MRGEMREQRLVRARSRLSYRHSSASAPSVRPSPAVSPARRRPRPPAHAHLSIAAPPTSARRCSAPTQRHLDDRSSTTSCSSDADIVVEAIGGVEPAADWIRRALLAGKSVVTANKQVIARHGAALLTLAARQGRQLRFEAAVGGAMPIVRASATVWPAIASRGSSRS